jgi:hypothetical protein
MITAAEILPFQSGSYRFGTNLVLQAADFNNGAT